jgi:hypothetical protein
MRCQLLRLVKLLGSLLVMCVLVQADWIVAPGVFNTPYGAWGPDGIPGTPDDPPPGGFGILSGYAGGSYLGPAGAVLTAHVEMNSTVVPAGGGWFQYTWTITNYGTGPFVEYWDTGNGPNFLQDPPLYGTAGPDRIPGTADDVAAESETDTRRGGPPILGLWGGVWNPEAEEQAQRYDPIPEPGTFGMWMLGAAGLIGWRLLAAPRKDW